MEPSKNTISETSKLLEVPKIDEYNSDEKIGQGRVMTFPDLPSIEIPKDNILDTPEHRVNEIYIITCKISNKSYVGQAYSHILNHNKYRRHGTIGRFLKHVAECNAPSRAKKQCCYLNNAIRKYKPESFECKLLKACKTKKEADMYEDMGIKYYNTLYPNGYNLRTGGVSFEHTEESRNRVSKGVQKFYDPKRVEKFKDVFIDKKIDPLSLIHRCTRNGKQYGWYMNVYDRNGRYLKTDFGGVRDSLEQSKERIIEFIKYLQNKEDVVKISSNETLLRVEMGNQQPSLSTSL